MYLTKVDPRILEKVKITVNSALPRFPVYISDPFPKSLAQDRGQGLHINYNNVPTKDIATEHSFYRPIGLTLSIGSVRIECWRGLV